MVDEGTMITLTERERDTVLAALRLWEAMEAGAITFKDQEQQAMIYRIAENGRTDPWSHLDENEVEDLRDRINN